MTTFERVRRVLLEEMDCLPQDVRGMASLVGDLDLDSMDRAQLILELEDEFQFEIPDDDMQSIFTVQDIVDYVDSHC
jgi:acyl carrier protein